MPRPRSTAVLSAARHLLALAVLGLPLALVSAGPPAQAVYGGSPAAPGQHPAVAAVVSDGTLCGGTLVAPTKVVTAAHCVTSGIVVALDLTGLDEITAGTAETHDVVATEVHPDWTGGFVYDVAVLTLDEPSAVTPVALVDAGDAALWAPGAHATVAGFGEASSSGGTSGPLRVAGVTVVGGCEAETVLCAGDGDPAACAGDSGGPLLVEDGERLVLAGLVLGGTTGCDGAAGTDFHARLGADPLRSWLVDRLPSQPPTPPADRVGPRVVAQAPTGRRVRPTASVRVRFSEPVARATVRRTSFRLLRLTPRGPRPVAARIVVAADGRSAVLDPRATLVRGQRYRVLVTTDVRDLAGNRLDHLPGRAGAQAKTWTFRVRR